MEVVVIDKTTFKGMLPGFEIFVEEMEWLCREQKDLGEKE